MQPEGFIFREIAAQQDRGGATIDVIRRGVDFRQKMHLTDTEIADGLSRLEALTLIRSNGDRYFVAESAVPSLPRTVLNQLSFRSRDWDQLWQSLLG